MLALKLDPDEILAATTTLKLKLLLAMLDLVNTPTGESGALATKLAPAVSPDDSSNIIVELSHLSMSELAVKSDGVLGLCGLLALNLALVESPLEQKLNSAQTKLSKRLENAVLQVLSSTGLHGLSALKNAKAVSPLDNGLTLAMLESNKKLALAVDLATTLNGHSGLIVSAAASRSLVTVENDLELETASVDLTMKSRNKTATWLSAAI